MCLLLLKCYNRQLPELTHIENMWTNMSTSSPSSNNDLCSRKILRIWQPAWLGSKFHACRKTWAPPGQHHCSGYTTTTPLTNWISQCQWTTVNEWPILWCCRWCDSGLLCCRSRPSLIQGPAATATIIIFLFLFLFFRILVWVVN